MTHARVLLTLLSCLVVSAMPARAATITLTGAGGSILDNDTLTSTVTSSDAGLITDVTLTLLDFAHTWAGDLTATLTFQSTTGTVFDGSGGNDFGGDYSFNDSFVTGIPYALNPIPGGFYFGTASDGTQILFSNLWNGLAATGDWTLAITDGAGGDDGDLGSWRLVIQVAPTATPVPEPATMLLFGTSLAGLAVAQQRRRRRTRAESDSRPGAHSSR
jgi:hypothetical protein